MPEVSCMQILSALSNQSRLDILECLREGEMCVNTLAERTGLSQPTLSKHVSQLLDAGLVTMRTEGKFHLFALDEKNSAPYLKLFLARPIAAGNVIAPTELMYVWDMRTNEQDWFGDVDGALGFEAGTFPRTVSAWEERLHPEDHQRVIEAASRHLIDRVPFFESYRIQRKDGTYVHWVDCGSVMMDATGTPYKWVGMTREVSPGVDGSETAG